MLSHHDIWSAVVHTPVSSRPHVMSLYTQEGQRCRMCSALWSSGIRACFRYKYIYGAFGACPKCWWKFLSVLSELHSVHDDIAKSTDHLDHSHDENKLFFRQITGYSSPYRGRGGGGIYWKKQRKREQ